MLLPFEKASNITNKQLWRTLSFPALAVCLAAAGPVPQVMTYDFGPVASNSPDVQTVDLRTPKPANVTWLVPPTVENVSKARAESRNAMTIDSVGGKDLAVRVPARAAFAHVAFVAEAGMQDKSELRFTIDGKPQELGWIGFDPPTEPRTEPRTENRLFSTVAETKGSRLDLGWSNPSDTVLLNWLQVIPLTDAKIGDAGLKQLMARAGDTQKMEPLAPLREGLRAKAPRLAGEAAVVDFWLETMVNADRYFEEYRGWSAADKKTGLSMFGRYQQAIMWLDGLVADPMFRDTPLYPRALFQRARLEYAIWLEQHDSFMQNAATRDWKALAALNVRPDLTPMYLGASIPHASPCDKLTTAQPMPAWATRQREAVCRLEELLGWWVDARQVNNGELGGKWGDDVEMLRWWQVPLLAGSPKAWQGWTRLADGVWSSDLIADGYHRRVSDVEHSAEPLSDPLLIFALSNDPTRVARLAPTARHFMNLWSRPVASDERRFRSAWIGSEGVDERPPRNRDVPMNARAMKAVRFHVAATDDPEAKRALLDWSRMWARATLSSAKGKPVGVVPPSLRFADGAINGDEPAWYRSNMFWDYYDWSGDAKIYDQLLFASTLSDDPQIRESLLKAFDFVTKYRNESGNDAPVGSERWAASSLLGDASFHAIWGQWRLSTEDGRYDAVLKQLTKSRYLKFRLTGDDTALGGASQGIVDRLRINWPLLTSEVLFTDRVYVSGQGDEVDTGDLLGMMTGALTTDSPYYHVTWHDRSGDLAYLVRDAGTDRLRLDIAAFSKNAKATAKFWRLRQGNYCLAIRDPSGNSTRENLALRQVGQAHLFELPVEGVYKVELSATAKAAAC